MKNLPILVLRELSHLKLVFLPRTQANKPVTNLAHELTFQGWRRSSLIEYFCSAGKALGWIPSTAKNKEKQNNQKSHIDFYIQI
jgi:hypothetical protein